MVSQVTPVSKLNGSHSQSEVDDDIFHLNGFTLYPIVITDQVSSDSHESTVKRP